MDISHFLTGDALHSNISLSLNSEQRIALNQILDAFLAVWQQNIEP